jgi:predicted nucleic acid-binding protein
VRLVVSDTSPVNYLVLTGDVQLLPLMFGRVAIPSTVQRELSSFDAPALVRNWIAMPPAWLEIFATEDVDPFPGLHRGESAAIALSLSLDAELLLMDERKGVKVARGRE